MTTPKRIIKHCAKCNKPFTTSDDSIVLCRACTDEKLKQDAKAEMERQAQPAMTKKCNVCGSEFVFTVGEKEFYESHGLKGTPNLCPDCRAKLREAKKEWNGGKVVCADCGKEFTVPDFLILRCYLNDWKLPTRCKACAEKQRRAMDNRRRGAPALKQVCKSCGKEFIITVGEKEFLESHGYEHLPTRCKACRRTRRVNALAQDMRREGMDSDVVEPVSEPVAVEEPKSVQPEPVVEAAPVSAAEA